MENKESIEHKHMKYLEEATRAKEALIKFWGRKEEEFFPAEDDKKYIKGEPLLIFPEKDFPGAWVERAYTVYGHFVDVYESNQWDKIEERTLKNPTKYIIHLFKRSGRKKEYKQIKQVVITDKKDIELIAKTKIMRYPEFFMVDCEKEEMDNGEVLTNYYFSYTGIISHDEIIDIHKRMNKIIEEEDKYEDEYVVEVETEIVHLMKDILEKQNVEIEKYDGINITIPILINHSPLNCLVFDY